MSAPAGGLVVEGVRKSFGKSEVLGGISRLSFQMNAASLPQVKMMRAIDAIGARVAPVLRERLVTERTQP